MSTSGPCEVVTMASLLTKVIGMMLAFVIDPESAVSSSPCAQVRVPANTVHLGSSISATCILSDGCPLAQGRDVRVEWRLNGRHLPAGRPANQSARSYDVVVPSFTDARGDLICCVRTGTECQEVAGVTVQAGYLPSPPRNLSCVTNLTRPCTLTCEWTPGPDSLLPTAYTLHTEIRHLRTERKTYTLPEGVHTYTIPRVDFALFVETRISVAATNALGQTSSEALLLDPMENAQFDPPEVLQVWAEPQRPGCLKMQWKLSDHQAWVVNVAVNISLRATDNQHWTSAMKRMQNPFVPETVEQCGLLHGTEYRAQARVSYPPGPWSAWSKPLEGTTPDRAPTGRLTTWLKVLGEPSGMRSALLFWKPSDQFRANGRNVSYHVLLKWPPDRRHDVLCDTVHGHCAFSLPPGATRVCITASNSAGESVPMWVPAYRHTALDPVSGLSISPTGDNSLLVSWVAPNSTALVGFTVEWSPLSESGLISLSFGVAAKSESSFLITDEIEPYQPYKISVYSRYDEGIGAPRTVEAYTLEKAPSEAPQLQATVIRHTSVELTWDDIPLEHRNGIVSYTIYYWNEEDQAEAVRIKPTNRRLILKDLKPLSMYKVLIQASTDGGSRNGTVLTFKTEETDFWDIMMSAFLIGILLLLPISVASVVCFKKRKRLKMRLWPVVPDPANSSIRDWKDTGMLQKDSHRKQDIHEASPVNLSWFNLMDIPEKEDSEAEESCQPGSQKGGDTGHCPEVHPSPGGDPSPRDSVPYVTVVFTSPYRSQAQGPPQGYLRSESTQPLLGDEPSSPTPSQEGGAESGSFPECGGELCAHKGGCVSWGDFPMLGALEIHNADPLY
uniref:Colony stimulating factor 3 receptor n=2 Tax=Paramormyrops kingsleyae TaxID=1676925 RepID=A0A3B3RMS1_9TELE|nr:granulocyte colony-stimulating factor receptor isoform X1 [Paramormyrops kingsleyae]